MPAKRALSAALALLLAVSFAAPSGARALSEGGFMYTVSGEGATITGCDGACPTTLVIPDTLGGSRVVVIDSHAFREDALTSVTIPNTVVSIGSSAFYSNALTIVTIPDSVTSIGSGAFAYNALTSVTIPNSVMVIALSAFDSNDLTSVTIPNSVTIIGVRAFAGNDLTSVTIPNSVTTIGGIAFADNDLTSVTIPDSVTTIGSYAFEFNLLTSVTFLGNAPTDGGDVFRNNSNLTSVTRPSTATGWGATWSGVTVNIAGKPRATVKPTVRGTARVGKTLTAAKGTWTESSTFKYQWYVCTRAVTVARTTVPSTCKRIPGATRSTFKLTSAQRNKFVAVRVTGTGIGGLTTTWLSKTATKIR